MPISNLAQRMTQYISNCSALIESYAKIDAQFGVCVIKYGSFYMNEQDQKSHETHRNNIFT